jgi:hypothetical protein
MASRPFYLSLAGKCLHAVEVYADATGESRANAIRMLVEKGSVYRDLETMLLLESERRVSSVTMRNLIQKGLLYEELERHGLLPPLP